MVISLIKFGQKMISLMIICMYLGVKFMCTFLRMRNLIQKHDTVYSLVAVLRSLGISFMILLADKKLIRNMDTVEDETVSDIDHSQNLVPTSGGGLFDLDRIPTTHVLTENSEDE